MNKKDFGNYFKTMRKQNNLTQKDVSDHIFVSIQSINKYEKGINYPDITILGDLANLFSVDLDSLFSLENACKNDNCKVQKFDINEFASNLSFLRKYNNLSLTEVSKFIGVQYQTISKWEKGESLPNIEQVLLCASLYKVSPSQLYFANITLNNFLFILLSTPLNFIIERG